MRVYISADIEGVTNVTDWTETERIGGTGYEWACEQMTREVSAACLGALEAGADEVVVKDSHDSALNLIPDKLPRGVKLIRGWAASTDSMMSLVDRDFDLAFMVGYHSEGYSNKNPLAHTMSYTRLMSTKLNGKLVSEMDNNVLICANHGVPIGLIAGDKALCDKAEAELPGVCVAAVKEGIGGATFSLHPLDACDLIKAQAYEAVKRLQKGEIKCIDMPEHFELEFMFKEHKDASNAANYIGAELVDAHTVVYRCDSFKEYITAYDFMH